MFTLEQLAAYAALAGAASGFIFGVALPFALKHFGPAREVAIAGADYVEALKGAVEWAERMGALRGIAGADKLAVAIKQMDAWLDNQGIHGDARKVTTERVKADIELTRARLFPKKAA